MPHQGPTPGHGLTTRIVRRLHVAKRHRLAVSLRHVIRDHGSESACYAIGESFYHLGQYARAREYFERVRHDAQLVPFARFREHWIRFHQGEVGLGWPPYPSHQSPGSGAAESGLDAPPTPMRSTKARSQPHDILRALDLAPWQPGRQPSKSLLVWFNFNNNVAGEVLCTLLLRLFCARYELPLVLAVDPRMRALISASLPACEVLRRDQVHLAAGRCSHFLLVRDLLGLLIRSESDFDALKGERLVIPPPAPRPAKQPGAALSVALSWRTTTTRQASYRDVAVEDLARLLTRHPVDGHVAQHGAFQPDVRVLKRKLGSRLRTDTIRSNADIDVLARDLASMDAVVTIENSLMALAGALGIPTFALVPIPGFWAFPASGPSSRWFESVTLLRQRRVGDWSAPLRELDRHLSNLTRARPTRGEQEA